MAQRTPPTPGPMSAQGTPYAPYGANHGRRLKRVMGYRQVLNAKTDIAAVGVNRARMQKNSPGLYYKNPNGGPIRPQNTYAGQEEVGYGYEFGAIVRTTAYASNKNLTPRNHGDMETRVPYLPALNGVLGNSVADVQEKLFCIGMLELPGRDTPSTGATIVLAGVETVTANFEDIFMGDYVMVVPPANNEVNSIVSRDGDAANGKRGRIPYVLKRFEPRKIDFYKRDNVVEVILHRIMQVEVEADGTKPRLTFRGSNNTAKDMYTMSDESFAMDVLERNGNNVMFNLITSYADMLCFKDGNENNRKENTHIAALLCLLSGGNYTTNLPVSDLVAKTLSSATRIVQVAAGKMTDYPGPRAPLQPVIEAMYNNAVNNAEKKSILNNNPLQRLLVAMAEKKLRVEECVKGLAVVDIFKGCDGEMHFTGY